MLTDERVNQLRRELCTLVAGTYLKTITAASLLEHKAAAAPKSAEAAAHRILLEASGELEKWIGEAGEGTFQPAGDRLSVEPPITAAIAVGGEGGSIRG